MLQKKENRYTQTQISAHNMFVYLVKFCLRFENLFILGKWRSAKAAVRCGGICAKTAGHRQHCHNNINIFNLFWIDKCAMRLNLTTLTLTQTCSCSNALNSPFFCPLSLSLPLSRSHYRPLYFYRGSNIVLSR